LRSAFERAFGGVGFCFEAADLLGRSLGVAQAVAGVRELLRHLRHCRRIGDLAVTLPPLGQFCKLLLQRAEFGEAVDFHLAPMLQIVLRAREQAVAARTALAVGKIAPELAVDLIDGAPGAPIGLAASPPFPKLTTEPCASPMRSAPGGVAAPSIRAEISSSSLLRTSGAGKRNAWFSSANGVGARWR
jgi:hypothetical protein